MCRRPEIERAAATRDAVTRVPLAHDFERPLIRRTTIELSRVVQDFDVFALQDDRQPAGNKVTREQPSDSATHAGRKFRHVKALPKAAPVGNDRVAFVETCWRFYT